MKAHLLNGDEDFTEKAEIAHKRSNNFSFRRNICKISLLQMNQNASECRKGLQSEKSSNLSFKGSSSSYNAFHFVSI